MQGLVPRTQLCAISVSEWAANSSLRPAASAPNVNCELSGTELWGACRGACLDLQEVSWADTRTGIELHSCQKVPARAYDATRSSDRIDSAAPNSDAAPLQCLMAVRRPARVAAARVSPPSPRYEVRNRAGKRPRPGSRKIQPTEIWTVNLLL